MFELLTTQQIQKEISSKVKDIRISLDKTQSSLAKNIGISKSTYIRFEQDGNCSFENFILIMQGIGRIGELNSILKKETYSPIQAMKDAKKNKPKQRAREKIYNTDTIIKPKTEEKNFMDMVKEAKNGRYKS